MVAHEGRNRAGQAPPRPTPPDPHRANSESLFISDLHLAPERPGTIALFLDFLNSRARQAARLFILGDLFDAWIGDDDDTPTHRAVIDALRGLSDSGTACALMHGNRDFLIGRRFARCRRLHPAARPDPHRARPRAAAADARRPAVHRRPGLPAFPAQGPQSAGAAAIPMEVVSGTQAHRRRLPPKEQRREPEQDRGHHGRATRTKSPDACNAAACSVWCTATPTAPLITSSSSTAEAQCGTCCPIGTTTAARC